MKRSIVAAVLVLGACASAPDLDYFTLDMTPSGRAAPEVNLAVERFRVSELLARDPIVIQHSETGIDFYATDRWAAGLGELVQRKLEAELGPSQDGRQSLRVGGVVLACQQLDVVGGAEARLSLAVEIREAGARSSDEPILVRTYTATRPADAASAGAVVRALSRAAEDIAVEIAADASALPAPGTGGG
jgi:uncharacterized lipoprotein YmbA